MPTPNEIQPIIDVSGLSIIYNRNQPNEVRAIEDISLKIYPQEYIIFFGPSGCGKSTLLYSVAGFQHPSEGTVVVSGRDINQLSKKETVDFHRRKIGMIFQSFFLIPTLSIIDNVCLPQTFLDVDIETRRIEGMKLLDRFGITEQANKFPVELSGGQKQRVAIARALMNNPDIIIADEPVGNLDSKSAFNVMSILTELNEKDKKTIILVSHEPTHLSYGSKIFHMHDGKIVKTEEVVEKKKIVLKGEEEEIVKKEMLSPELQMLTRSFRNFSPKQLGMLLIPFKSQEFISHILLNVPQDQLNAARSKLQEVISGRTTLEDFEKFLDLDENKGGLGWDKRNVKRFVGRLREIVEASSKIESKNPDKSAEDIVKYLTDLYKLELDGQQISKLKEIIRMRLQNELSITEFAKALDRPASERGLGLDRRVASKLARELEILMLAHFSG